MAYLYAQIWLYIAVAAAIGLLFGAMFRGGATAARMRELKHDLAHAQKEAVEQRREAAELAARAERRHTAGPSPEVLRLQNDLRGARERISHLESEAREAGGAIDRYAEEAEELRRRIADLMTRSGGVGADERAAWRARMGELEEEAESLRRRLDQRDAEAAAAAQAQIAALEVEGETLRQHIQELLDRSAGDARTIARMADLETEASNLRAQLESSRDATKTALGSLEAERDALLRRLEETDRVAGVVETLRARVADLEGSLAGAETSLAAAQATAEAARGAAAAEITELSAKVSALELDVGQAAALRERIGHFEAEATTLRAEIAAHREKVAALEAEAAGIPALKEQIALFEAEAPDVAALRQEIVALEAKAAELPALTGRIAELEADAAELAALTGKIGALEADADHLRRELDRRDAEAQELDRMRDQMRQRIGELEADLDISRSRAAAAVEPPPVEAPARELPPAGAGEDLRVETARLKWRNSYLTSRIHFLESQLKEEEARRGAPSDAEEGKKLAHAREEVARLSARIAELEKAAAPDRSAEPAPNVEGGGGSLEWRNRYLASRVRYLEQRLEEVGANGHALGDDEMRQKLAQAHEDLRDMARLKSRVAELERDLDSGDALDGVGLKNDNQRAQEWRIRYLSSRVKYLEDRLARAGASPESAEVD